MPKTGKNMVPPPIQETYGAPPPQRRKNNMPGSQWGGRNVLNPDFEIHKAINYLRLYI